jgi:hypothetical protein
MRGKKAKMAHYPGEILYRMLTRRNEERYGKCKQHKMSKKPTTLATTYTLSDNSITATGSENKKE